MNTIHIKITCSLLLAAVLTVMSCAVLAGCESKLYALDGSVPVMHRDADIIERPYTEAECRAEAERLLMTRLETVEKHVPRTGKDTARYTFRSESLPFDVSVYSEHSVYKDPSTGKTVLYAHAYTDYYSAMIGYKRDEYREAAEKYGLEITEAGQSLLTYITGYDQLENVYDFLDETNRLFDFTVDENEMVNILRDIRNRPTLTVYYRFPENEDGPLYKIDEKIITLYYTVNHEKYQYNRDALLGAMQEQYIETLDRAGIKDAAITDEIRENRVKSALYQLRINGKPVEKKECEGFTLDPNVVFDYNWLMGDYFGDIRLCAPADDYDAPPGLYGDDRNFRYLVELLGGRYESRLDDDLVPDTYKADWWLGGSHYTASSMCVSHIPVWTDFWKDDEYLRTTHAYSKNMWGLENGYGAEDYYIRITPASFASLLGAEAVPDYENGTLDLITPEGYFDYEPPEPESEQQLIDETGPIKDNFVTENLWSDNGLVKNHTHYIIYADDGTVMEEETTKNDLYAECEQLDRHTVALRITGVGNKDQLAFFHTDTKEISRIYEHATLLGYPYVIYEPPFSGDIVVENVDTGARSTLLDDGYKYAPCIERCKVNDDGTMTVRYSRRTGEESSDFEAAEKTVVITLP